MAAPRPERDSNGWLQAILAAVAALVLAALAFAMGGEESPSRAVFIMGLVFHGLITLACAANLFRLEVLTRGREEQKAMTAGLLGLGTIAGLALLARDFGII